MNTRSKTLASGGVAVGAVAAIIAGVFAFGATNPAPEPTPTTAAVLYERPANLFADTATVIPAAEEAKAAKAEAERVAAEAAAAEAARVEAERVAAEQAAQDQQAAEEPTEQGSAPVESGGGAPAITKCPAGTVAGQVDGDGNESLCQTPCSEWVDLDGDGTAETCARP